MVMWISSSAAVMTNCNRAEMRAGLGFIQGFASGKAVVFRTVATVPTVVVVML